ncbi:Uncharacterized protein HZ326_30216 [Fusarium oxysporum f. sp. albedinis]|nr:Uncharacterized protein HZ326_30216 [Fusarium oxysporum f. sp. albedinis]
MTFGSLRWMTTFISPSSKWKNSSFRSRNEGSTSNFQILSQLLTFGPLMAIIFPLTQLAMRHICLSDWQ